MPRRIGVFSFFLFFATALTQAQSSTMSGEWKLTTMILGHPLGERLTLNDDKGQLTGSVYRDENVALKGSVNGSELQFSFKESDGTINDYKGKLTGDNLAGQYISTDRVGERKKGSGRRK